MKKLTNFDKRKRVGDANKILDLLGNKINQLILMDNERVLNKWESKHNSDVSALKSKLLAEGTSQEEIAKQVVVLEQNHQKRVDEFKYYRALLDGNKVEKIRDIFEDWLFESLILYNKINFRKGIMSIKTTKEGQTHLPGSTQMVKIEAKPKISFRFDSDETSRSLVKMLQEAKKLDK